MLGRYLLPKDVNSEKHGKLGPFVHSLYHRCIILYLKPNKQHIWSPWSLSPFPGFSSRSTHCTWGKTWLPRSCQGHQMIELLKCGDSQLPWGKLWPTNSRKWENRQINVTSLLSWNALSGCNAGCPDNATLGAQLMGWLCLFLALGDLWSAWWRIILRLLPAALCHTSLPPL